MRHPVLEDAYVYPCLKMVGEWLHDFEWSYILRNRELLMDLQNEDVTIALSRGYVSGEQPSRMVGNAHNV